MLFLFIFLLRNSAFLKLTYGMEFSLERKRGDAVQSGDTLAVIHARSEAEAREAETMLRSARQEVASLALLAAAKAAGRSMDGNDDKAFVDEFLSEVGEQA